MLEARVCQGCNISYRAYRDYFHRTRPFCTPACYESHEQIRVKKFLTSGIPIIEIKEDSIVCNICGKEMKQASTHFRRTHCMTTLRKGLTHTERQIIYHTTQGTRMVSDKLLGFYKQAAKDRNAVASLGDRRFGKVMFVPYKHPWPQRSDKQQAVSRAPRSDKQKETMRALIGTPRHGGVVRRERARTVSPCVVCGKEIVYVKSQNKKLCGSASCLSTLTRRMNTKRWADPKTRYKMSEGLKKTRKEKYWHSRPPEKYRKDIVCKMCGITFNIEKSKQRTFCGKVCYHKARKSKC